eukprot:272622-Chlamydomonas_euryale.AAC.4
MDGKLGDASGQQSNGRLRSTPLASARPTHASPSMVSGLDRYKSDTNPAHVGTAPLLHVAPTLAPASIAPACGCARTMPCRWQKTSPAESSCIMELRRQRGDVILQVVFSNKASLPETMHLYAGPKVVGPFSMVCSGLVLPQHTKHCLNLGSWDTTMKQHRYLKLLFAGTQSRGQGDAQPVSPLEAFHSG